MRRGVARARAVRPAHTDCPDRHRTRGVRHGPPAWAGIAGRRITAVRRGQRHAARTGAALSVFLGSWLALSAVAGFGVLIGSWLQQRVALWRIGVISGVVLAVLAIVTVVELLAV